MLTARTLAEAQVYVSLVIAADTTVPAAEPPDIVPGVNLTEGVEAWTLTSPAGEIAISYASEDACRALGVWFGLGVSRLIDAAQWAMVAQTYARRALEADMAYNGGSDQDRFLIEKQWEAAAEAVGEALKFMPDGAQVPPDEAVWSEFGREARARNPQLITRTKLADDLEYYRGTLSDFRALHGNG
ncbi:MAG: hypothetical protein HOQ05_12330 [Corynebacteriales bacterium]|nr:hypothetical protein [Mycobacteriales bacterium]